MNGRLLAMAAATLLAGLVSTPAYAHFVLNAPPSYAEQDTLGSPQKSAPCGQLDPGDAPVATNEVTTFQQGSMITIKINETIFHPGHYRVLLAQNQAALPADPPVTAGSTACGSTVITQNPTLPLLADGLLKHTAAFNGEKTMQVQLPAGMTCDHCTLQITEFMSNHPLNNPGGCFYHHCATVSITAAAVPDAGPGAPDAGPTGSVDAAPPADQPDGGQADTGGDGGCGCRTQGHPASSGGVILVGLLVGLLALRRRRG